MSRQQYCSLIKDFHGFYKPLEALLSDFFSRPLQHPGFDFSMRCKVPLLEKDLYALGLSESEVAKNQLCTRVPHPQSLSYALGVCYVLEGQTLGGKILSAHFTNTLRLDEKSGLAFFCSYGTETGRLWKEFCEVLIERSTQASTHSEILLGAQHTFELFIHWMRKSVPD